MEKNINFLVDTNVWLERLLDQEKSEEVRMLLESIPSNYLFISDFTLHSIGVVLFRNNKEKLLLQFIEDLFDRGTIQLVSLDPFDQIDLIELSQRSRLDFDDAYQHKVADKFELRIITFDKDFRKGKVKFLAPLKAIEIFNK